MFAVQPEWSRIMKSLLSIGSRLLTAAALAVGLHAAPAAAATYPVGPLSASPYVNSAVLPAGSFVDIYNFSVTAPAQVGASAVSLDLLLHSLSLLHIGGLSLSLYDGTDTLLGSWGGSPVNFDSLLGAGNYHINVAGNADGLTGGAYLFSIAAIPEPEQWLLFAAGLGLLGAISRRRRADR
jgi:hypothetical protein